MWVVDWLRLRDVVNNDEDKLREKVGPGVEDKVLDLLLLLSLGDKVLLKVAERELLEV